jgi:AmiR/NasT family two-component response regulator
MRVLIADDEAVIRMGLRAMLEDAGHVVAAAATDGQTAIAMAQTVHPDLIILDIKMNGMDGLEAARQIMSQHPTPIIMLTAYSQRELVEQAKAASVFAYLVKPVKEELLVPTLELAVTRFQEWQTLRQEVQDLHQSLVVRDLVERAKRALMEHEHLTERQAYMKLQRQSRSRRVPMQKVAEQVLRRMERGAKPGGLA